MYNEKRSHRLPILSCISEAYEFLWSNRADFILMSALPVFILALVHTAAFSVFPQQGSTPPINAIAVRETAAAFLYAMFGVAWHRRFLRETEQVTVWEALRWDARKTLFFIRFITAAFCATAAALPIFAILFTDGSKLTFLSTIAGNIGIGLRPLIALLTIAAISIWMLVFTRLSLWLPATAVDEKHTIVSVWSLGESNGWSLVAITIGAMLPLIFLVSFAVSLVVFIITGLGIQSNLTGHFIMGLALGFTKYLALAAEITALSIAYKKLSKPAY
ncbi:MAG: hypothetical protein VX941_02825 [Pseudomonadota bacterium]|nr:hypothetical protein [Pseudomonadota bacterium]